MIVGRDSFPKLAQNLEDRGIEIIQQALCRMLVPFALVEAPVPVFPKRDILKCLYRCSSTSTRLS